jgi:uncharacterized protein
VAPRELCFETRLCVPLERLFAFFDRTDNLGVLMQGYRAFRLDAPGTRDGEPVRVRVRLGPLWLRMEFCCCARSAPHLLAERLTRGPFAHLLHRHEFRSRDGATVMLDRLRFRVPPALGGGLVSRLLVEPAMRRMFRFRRRRLQELARRGALDGG